MAQGAWLLHPQVNPITRFLGGSYERTVRKPLLTQDSHSPSSSASCFLLSSSSDFASIWREGQRHTLISMSRQTHTLEKLDVFDLSIFLAHTLERLPGLVLVFALEVEGS